MSSFGFGPSKKGRTADASMMTRNVRITSQGAADASYSGNPKKNPFRLSTAILNGGSYASAITAQQNMGFLPTVPPYVYTQQALVDLFSQFTIGTWTLNGSAASSVSPPGIQLMYANTGAVVRASSTFNNNAVINVSYPFTITETFNMTNTGGTVSVPTDGFCITLSPNNMFLGGGGGNLGIVGSATPAVGISVNFDDQVIPGTFRAIARITTNALSDPYTGSSVILGSIINDVITRSSVNIKVSVTYDGSNTMAWSVSEGAYLVSSSQTGINLQTLLMSSNAYLGATAGSGGRYQPVYLTGTTYQTYA